MPCIFYRNNLLFATHPYSPQISTLPPQIPEETPDFETINKHSWRKTMLCAILNICLAAIGRMDPGIGNLYPKQSNTIEHVLLVNVFVGMLLGQSDVE